MMERNFYLAKVREVEEYGRAQQWGKPVGGQGHGVMAEMTPGTKGDGIDLLRSIAAVLYDGRSNPATPRAR